MEGVPFELVAPPVVAGPAPALATEARHGVHEVHDWTDGRRILLAVGGGRVMVAAALRSTVTGLPWVAVPTSYAPACVAVRPPPRRVVADGALPAAAPPAIRRLSLAAARAVAVEALWAPDGTPSVRYVALSAFRTLHRALREPGAGPLDEPDVQRAALIAGIGSANCGPGLLCVLAQQLDERGVEWARAMAALLPGAVRLLAPAAPDAVATIADVLGAGSLPEVVDALRTVAVPDLAEDAVESLLNRMSTATFSAPSSSTTQEIRGLLRTE